MPTPRPRVVVRGRFPTVYHPKEYTAWKEQAAEIVRAHAALPPEEHLDRPLAISMVIKASRPKTSKLNHPAPDVDNYAKGVLDALTQSERTYRDDKQVTDLRVVKRWADGPDDVGVHVTLTYN